MSTVSKVVQVIKMEFNLEVLCAVSGCSGAIRFSPVRNGRVLNLPSHNLGGLVGMQGSVGRVAPDWQVRVHSDLGLGGPNTPVTPRHSN